MQPGLGCDWFLVEFEEKYSIRYHGLDIDGFFDSTG
jgi:hypothetical protein